MLDIGTLIPHSKKDSKLDTKNPRDAAGRGGGHEVLHQRHVFECRKRTDCYMWLAKCPDGPSVKFHVENVHTMAELKLTGNHLKFSRPALHFDATFDDAHSPHLGLIKEMLVHCFSTPYKHHKMKPFLDHVLSFYWEDGRVWFRNYQIVYPEGKEVRGTGGDPLRGGASPVPPPDQDLRGGVRRANAVRRSDIRLPQRAAKGGEEEGPGKVSAKDSEEGRAEGARPHERAQAGRTGRLERVRGIEGRSVTRARFGCDETRTCRVPRERLRS